MKILLVGAELSHADGQTDRHGEVYSRSSQFLRTHLKRYEFRQQIILPAFIQKYYPEIRLLLTTQQSNSILKHKRTLHLT